MTDLPLLISTPDLAKLKRIAEAARQPLPLCPYDRRSPDYWTAPNDKPCVVCGGEPEGPDKCRGADTRVYDQAADAILALIVRIEALEAGLKEAFIAGWWVNAAAPDENGAGSREYFDSCAEVDWREYIAGTAALNPESKP